MSEKNLTVLSKNTKVVAEEEFEGHIIRYSYEIKGDRNPDEVSFEVRKKPTESEPSTFKPNIISGNSSNSSFYFHNFTQEKGYGVLSDHVQEVCDDIMTPESEED